VSSNFQIDENRDGEAWVLSLAGFLDAHTAPRFEKAIEQNLKAGRVKLVVDCSRLTYISSAGLGVFMSFLEEIREQGGDLKVAGLDPKVYQVFEVLGFPALLDIQPTVADAAARFAANPPGA
jgi:anti-sigma B factor antagonist